MAELYDVNGNPIVAFTEEEMDAQKETISNEAIENYKKEHPENVEVEELQTELADAKKELELFGGTDKGKNVAALRIAKESAEKKIIDLETLIKNEIGGIKTLIGRKELENNIKSLSEGDEELGKKIEFQFNRIVKDTDSDEERKKKLGEAYVLASGGKPSNILNKVLGSSGAPIKQSGGAAAGFSSELVGLGKKLGITEEDIKKYNKK